MIRYVVGDSVFKRSITNYLKKHAYSNVLNDDFKMTFMETAGVNLDWFFNQWVYRAGFPEYDVSYELQNERVAFFVKQIQKVDELTSYFKMPVVFEVHFKDGSSSTKKEWISHAFDTMYVSAPAGAEIDYTLFDPGSNLIKQIYFHKSFDELAAQAEKAIHMIDRSDALGFLRDTALEKKKDLLIRIFNKGNYYTIQNEVVLQLSKDTSAAVIDLLRRALHSKDLVVRRAVVDNLTDVADEIPSTLLPDVEMLLRDSSYYTVENTLRKLCKNNSDKDAVRKYLNETKNVIGLNNNVRITWLEISISETDSALSQKFKKQLVEYTSNRYEFRTRAKAIETLELLKYCDEELIKNLLNACTYTNNRINRPASKFLKSLLNKTETLELAKGVFAANNWKEWEKKIIEPLLK